MKSRIVLAVLVSIFCLGLSTQDVQAVSKIKLKVSKAILDADSSILATNGSETVTTEITSRNVNVEMPSKTAALYLLKEGEIASIIAVADCSAKTGKCKNSKVKTTLKAGKDLGTLKSKQSGSVLLASGDAASLAKIASGSKISIATLGDSIASHGRSTNETNSQRRRVGVFAVDEDQDGDILPDSIDADDDGDGIIDNYDSGGSPSNDENSFRVFSNLKVEISRTLNANTGTTPTTAEIDSLLSEIGSLAIEVAGDSGAGDTTELNCGGLNYCSLGGSGQSNASSFPDSFDSDNDGFGTIVAGGTGDFQLQHGASSTQIAGGNTLIEVVTDSANKETEIPGLLNFTFYTSPALKSVALNGGSTYTVTYPATQNMQGSLNNCFVAPGGWDGSMTITAWRPQRAGDSVLGEADFMDIGHSLVTIDVPNGPCSSGNSGGCSGSGPGNCSVSSYSIPGGETNLSLGADSMTDAFEDTAASASNTFSFNFDVDTCLGSDTLDSGEKVVLDLQVRSQDGDNAAVKFCVQKP